ncbi:MAG: DUF421 domain-containing protein [Bacillota bacterium]|jgi:uncharacterized membrane protein YcaP (DUF421 family)
MLLSAIRTVILFLAVTIVMRLMGKRQVGEMQPYELVVAVLIAELAAIPMENTDIPLINGLVPIIVLLLLQMGLSEVALWSETARKLICGTPAILIRNGEIEQEEMRRLRVNLNDLLEQLRDKGYPNLADVDYAILENNGQLSVIPKAGKGPVTADDLGIEVSPTGLPISLILDGRVNQRNLQLSGLTPAELEKMVLEHGCQSFSEVFFANIDETGSVHVQKKQGRKQRG